MTASTTTGRRPVGPPIATRHAILDLFARNAWALDAHDLDRYLADFAPHAVFVETGADGAEREHVGIDEIEFVAGVPSIVHRSVGPWGVPVVAHPFA